MSKNYRNNKSQLVTIGVVLVATLAVGYLLAKSSPNTTQQNQNPATANVDNMHGGPTFATNSDTLNSLVGKPIPNIELKDKDGKTYSATDFKGKNTVLFFNEGLMCYPACWNQIASFGSDQRFNSDQIQAVSVVVDSANDWKTAIDKMPQLARAVTMFDTNANASRQFGLLTTASSMHKGSLPGHTYVVIDKEGVVRYVFDDPNMAIANDMLFSKIAELQ